MKWNDLPEQVREAVEAQTGPIASADAVEVGDSNDLAAVVDTGTRRLFVKAVQGDGRKARWLRNEHTFGHLTEGIAPSPRFACQVENWLVVGFDQVTGHPADLSPGSSDLPRVTDAVDEIARRPGGDLRPLSDRWADTGWWEDLKALPASAIPAWDVTTAATRASAIAAAVVGDRLVHTDLHAQQFIVDTRHVWVVDWGWPARGAAWVDAAFMVIRLVGAGHSPHKAEQWAAGLACWASATKEDLDTFACHVAGLWSLWAVQPSSRAAQSRATWARAYAEWRMT